MLSSQNAKQRDDRSRIVNLSCARICHAPWTLALILALAACASGAGGSGGGGSADLITQEQIDAVVPANALEVVRRYRPRWLQPMRNPTSAGVVPVVGHPGMPQDPGQMRSTDLYATVVRDGVRLGEIDTLASVDARTVVSIRLLSPTDARTRYGSGYDGGVIELVSR
jgi:hypothetical protein